MLSPLEILRRNDRYELADNRMTLYAPGFGLGSVHYWDGSWDNDEDEIPYQSREVFENRDGELEIILASGEIDVLQKDRHQWQPHRIETRFVGTNNTVWDEKKAIHDDVAVTVIRAVGHGLKTRRVTVRHRISGGPQLQIKATSRGVHLLATSGRYAGVHRFLGFSGKSKVRLTQDEVGASLLFTLDIPSEASTEFAFVVAAGENKAETQGRFRAALESPNQAVDGARARWQQYFDDHVPGFDCDCEKWTKLYYFACYVLRANLYDFKKGAIQNPYSCPSKWRLMPSWFWDPCFHGFAEKWLRNYPAPLSTFRNHLAAQEANGYLPMTLDHRGNTWKVLGAGEQMCQAFLHPITVWDHYLVHGDKAVLTEMLDAFARHDLFIGREREVDELFVPRGGGELADNSSRLVADIAERDQISVLSRQIQPVDWNSYQCVSERLIARMAKEIGRADLERDMTARADAKSKALRGLWNSETGLFADRIVPGGQLSGQKFPESLVALFAGCASAKQVKSAVEFLTDPKELWTQYPVPTLPLSDPQFSAEDCYASYWNGRVWPPLNWVCIEGLARTGQVKVARQLMQRMLEMFVATGEAHCMENYSPLSSERFAPPHSIFNQSWGALAIDLIIRRGMGLQLNAPQGEVSVSPLGLPGATRASLRGVPCGKRTIDVSVTFAPSTKAAGGRAKAKAKVKVTGGVKLVPAGNHWLQL